MPCYNEALRLQTAQFLDFAKRGYPIRFIFVNDGSTDTTIEVLESMRNGFEEHIQILDKPRNGGKGEAVRDGMLKACCDQNAGFVGFWDADLATPLEAIPLLLERLEGDGRLQMVFGSRVLLLGREIHRKASRHYFGRVFATVVSFILRLPVYDTQCGAKLFRITPNLSEILTEPFISRWVFDVEILARYISIHKGETDFLLKSIYELPLPRWEEMSGSKLRMSDFFQAIIDVQKIYRKYLA